MDGRFRTLAQLDLPTELMQLCDQVAEPECRVDVSSTQLRRSGP
jgi:hypothetical protein